MERLEIWRFEISRTFHTAAVSYLFTFDILVEVSDAELANCFEHRCSKDFLSCFFPLNALQALSLKNMY